MNSCIQCRNIWTTQKSLNKCDTAIIMHLLLQFKHMLGDIKLYVLKSKETTTLIQHCSKCFLFQAFRVHNNGLDFGNTINNLKKCR